MPGPSELERPTTSKANKLRVSTVMVVLVVVALLAPTFHSVAVLMGPTSSKLVHNRLMKRLNIVCMKAEE